MVLTSTSQHSTDSVQGVDFCIVFRLNKKKHIRKYSPKTEHVQCRMQKYFLFESKAYAGDDGDWEKNDAMLLYAVGHSVNEPLFFTLTKQMSRHRKPNESTAHKLYAKNTFILQLYTCFELFIFLLARFLWLDVHFLA